MESTLCHILPVAEGLGKYLRADARTYTYVCAEIIPPIANRPVGWGCRIHRLHLYRGVRPPHECPGYDTKQSDGTIYHPLRSGIPRFRTVYFYFQDLELYIFIFKI